MEVKARWKLLERFSTHLSKVSGYLCTSNFSKYHNFNLQTHESSASILSFPPASLSLISLHCHCTLSLTRWLSLFMSSSCWFTMVIRFFGYTYSLSLVFDSRSCRGGPSVLVWTWFIVVSMVA